VRLILKKGLKKSRRKGRRSNGQGQENPRSHELVRTSQKNREKNKKKREKVDGASAQQKTKTCFFLSAEAASCAEKLADLATRSCLGGKKEDMSD